MHNIKYINIYNPMSYNIDSTQGYFEFLVVVALLINLMVFITITFRPSALRTLANWATQVVDRAWKGFSSDSKAGQ